ncbi:hypothetical protein GUH47_28900 [Xanthomonas citri pv. citri]|nr:hypothetical protein [Xanthomonas citri pv. citri]
MENTPFPDFVKDAPELAPGLALYYVAYWDLNSDRDNGGPIRWTAIMQYCGYHQFDEDQREALFYHCRALDAAVAKAKGKEG